MKSPSFGKTRWIGPATMGPILTMVFTQIHISIVTAVNLRQNSFLGDRESFRPRRFMNRRTAWPDGDRTRGDVQAKAFQQTGAQGVAWFQEYDPEMSCSK